MVGDCDEANCVLTMSTRSSEEIWQGRNIYFSEPKYFVFTVIICKSRHVGVFPHTDSRGEKPTLETSISQKKKVNNLVQTKKTPINR